MKLCCDNRQYRARRANFTLIELLAVMVIVLVILGMTLGALRFSGGVDAGARSVSKQLYLARQYAISRRTHVAVLFPDYTNGTADASWKNYAHDYERQAFRPCRVTKSGTTFTFKKFIPGSSWIFLPTNQEFRLYDPGNDDFPKDSETYPAQTPFPQVQSVPVVTGASTFNMRAIIFQPNGSLVDPITNVSVIIRTDRHAGRLGSAESSTDDSTNLADNETKQIRLNIRALTGRVEYEQID